MNDNLLRCPECLRVIEIPEDSASPKFRCKKCKVFFQPQGPGDSDFELKTPDFKEMSNELLEKAKSTGSALPQKIKSNVSKSLKDWVAENFPEEHREYMIKDLKLRLLAAFGYGIGYGFVAFIASIFAVNILLALMSPLIYTEIGKTAHYRNGSYRYSTPIWGPGPSSNIVEYILAFVAILFVAFFFFRGFQKGFYTDMSTRLNKDKDS